MDDFDFAARGEEAEFVEKARAEILGELERAEEGGVVDRAVIRGAEYFEELRTDVHFFRTTNEH